jgi:hypothetical protein
MCHELLKPLKHPLVLRVIGRSKAHLCEDEPHVGAGGGCDLHHDIPRRVAGHLRQNRCPR